MVTSRSVAALAPVTLLALTAFLASSCDWISGDIFPSWLPYVEARADLAAAAEAEIGTLRNLDAVEYIRFVDPADNVDKLKILAYVRGLDGEALVAFEPAGMGIAKKLKRGTDPLVGLIGSRIAATPGGFISGTLAFNMADLEEPPTLVVGGTMPGGILLARGNPVEYYLMYTWYDTALFAYQLVIQKFDIDFNLLAISSRPLDTTGSSINLVDAVYFEAAGSTEALFRLLLDTVNGTYLFSFTDELALFSPAPLMDDATAIRTGPIPMGNSGRWLTSDGIVTMDRSSETIIGRYAYDGTAVQTTPTDLLHITGDTEAYQVLSFDDSGSWWYLHDQLTQHLYALRTWW